MQEQMIKDTAKLVDLELTNLQIKQIKLFIDMLLERNKYINLTAITEDKDIAQRHLLDSFCLLPYLKGDSLVDIGTGAGFPGILLKIIRPDLNVLLVDSTMKKITFVDEVIDQLKLKNIFAIHARAEELAHDKKYREKFDLATARAVASLAILVELSLPLLRPGGTFLAMKGPDDELNTARRAIAVLGGENTVVKHYSLPNTDLERSLLIIPKVKRTKARYPRAFAAIKRSPL